MPEKKIEVIKKSTIITLQLVKEPAAIVIGVKGKRKIEIEKDETGEPASFIRNDVAGLTQLLARFDTRKYQVRDWQRWTQVKKKLYECYLENKLELSLNLEEAEFLKRFLKDFSEKEGKDTSLREFEVRTLLGILDQFNERT